MYGIVIGASDEAIYAIKKAQSKGITVLAFDGDEHAAGLQYADEAFVVDIRDVNNIIKVIDEKGIQPKDMFVLPVPIGRYLISTGAFNEHYGLLGPTFKTTELCTDKWLFHETMAKSRLRNIWCKLLKEGETLDTIDHYPVIVKPRYGAGSREVLTLSNEDDFKAFKNRLPFDEDFIVEDEVSGCEYGIDGMVMDGEFQLILARKKLITPPPYRQCVGYLSLKKSDEKNAIIKDYMTKLVSAIGLHTGVLHADLMLNEDGPFVIEMSARPSGHRLHNLFTPIVTGIDMISDYIDFAEHKKIERPNKTDDANVYLIRYFDIESEIKRVPDKEYIMKKYSPLEYECHLNVGEKVKIKDGHSLMSRGFFILKGDSEEEITQKANDILKEYY